MGTAEDEACVLYHIDRRVHINKQTNFLALNLKYIIFLWDDDETVKIR